MFKRSTSVCIALAVVLGVSVPTVRAQIGIDQIQAQGASYHVYARTGEATIQVLILNSMGQSGIFRVGAGIRLDELMAAAGVVLPAETEDARPRKVTVRLFREAAGVRTLIYEAPFEEVMTQPGQYPVLEENDLLSVETILPKKRLSWRDATYVVSAVSSLSLLIIRFAGFF